MKTKEKSMSNIKNIGSTPSFRGAIKLPKDINLGPNFSRQRFIAESRGILNAQGQYSLYFQSGLAESEALAYLKARGIVPEHCEKSGMTLREFVKFSGL